MECLQSWFVCLSFPDSTLNTSDHTPMTCKITVKKQLIKYRGSFYVTFISLADLKSLPLMFVFLSMICTGMSLFVLTCLGFSYSLDIVSISFFRLGKF